MIKLPFFLVSMMRGHGNFVLAAICILVIFICSNFVFSYGYPVEAPPPWLKVGTYVEYSCIAYVYEEERPFVFRWECTALSGLTATLKLDLIGLPARNLSATVDIITNTRELISANGTVLGRAFLWLPPNLKVGDRVIVDGKPPTEIVSEVKGSGGGSCLTCQGYQESYCAITVNYSFGRASVIGIFDLDTGLVLNGPTLDHSTILSRLGLTELGWIKFLNATNVDLGPRYLYTEVMTFLLDTLPIWVPTTVFITVVAVFIRRRRKGARRILKRLKQ
jgi:hypothetical protein